MADMKKLIPILALLLAACDPTFNWRDYQSTEAKFSAQFPGKPASHTRSIDLNGLKVDMTMTAADVDGALFAVGSATVPDAAQAPAALEAMKTAMVRNVGGTVASEARASANGTHSVRIQANGSRNGQPVKLVGRFEARGVRVYQAIIIGPDRAVTPENIDQFMSSFKPQ
jgi:hypothetical protein